MVISFTKIKRQLVTRNFKVMAEIAILELKFAFMAKPEFFGKYILPITFEPLGDTGIQSQSRN